MTERQDAWRDLTVECLDYLRGDSPSPFVVQAAPDNAPTRIYTDLINERLATDDFPAALYSSFTEWRPAIPRKVLSYRVIGGVL